MTNILQRYLFAFFHPFQVQDYLRRKREDQEENKLLSINKSKDITGGVDYYESLSISWLFALLNAFYSIVTIHIGVYSYEILKKESGLGFGFKHIEQESFLFHMLLGLICFPISAWFWVKLWVVLIKFFANLFNIPGDIDKVANEITHNALAGHTLLIIPVFGNVAQKLAGLIFLYAGLKKNLSLNTMQALMILVSPLLLLLALIFLLIVSLFIAFIGH